jgi:peptide/nickel transport system substrate-binding protein
VRRRDLLTAAAATTFVAGVAPRLGFGADRAKTLIFTGVADLSVLDPVVTGARPTRNSAYLVFDTLYGLDTNWQAQPQMVEGHEVSADKLSWTLKLREGGASTTRSRCSRRTSSPAFAASRLGSFSPAR